MQTHEIINLNRILAKLKSAREKKVNVQKKKADKVDGEDDDGDEYLNTEMSVVSRSGVTMKYFAKIKDLIKIKILK